MNGFNVELAGNDEFGRVSRAALTITGRICTVQVRKAPELAERDALLSGDWTTEVSVAVASLGDACLDNPPDTDVIRAIVLTVVTDRTHKWWALLLISPVEELDTYERTGIASVYRRDMSDDPAWMNTFSTETITPE